MRVCAECESARADDHIQPSHAALTRRADHDQLPGWTRRLSILGRPLSSRSVCSSFPADDAPFWCSLKTQACAVTVRHSPLISRQVCVLFEPLSAQMEPQTSAGAADADADPAQASTSCDANERRGSSDATLGRASVDGRVRRRRSTRERISGLSTEDMLLLDEDSLASPLRESATRIPASCATFLSAEERGAPHRAHRHRHRRRRRCRRRHQHHHHRHHHRHHTVITPGTTTTTLPPQPAATTRLCPPAVPFAQPASCRQWRASTCTSMY